MVSNIEKIVKKEGAPSPKKKIINHSRKLFDTLEKIKLCTSRRGILHGIRSIKRNGEYAKIVTHCGACITIRDSRNSRTARWLRNRWLAAPCPKCKVPEWKLEKYSSTSFAMKGKR